MHERYLKNNLEYYGFRYFVDSEPWEAQWMTTVPDQEAIDDQGLPKSEVTLAEVLKQRGYRTALIGKWHLGWLEGKLPSDFGFDEQYGFFNSHSLYSYEATPGIVDQKIEADWTDPYIWNGQRNGPHAIYRNNKEVKEEAYLTDRITEETLSFIDNSGDQPFFIWASYNAPHTPLQAPQEYVDQYADVKDPIKRVYYAMIKSLDDNLGKLMAELEDTGLDSNTLIFFISDNGGAEYTHTTDNGPYECGKNTEFEGGIKVPMMVKWPAKIPGGQRYSPMVSAMDIFGTSARITGELPEGRIIDGVNLLPYLTHSIDSTHPTHPTPHKYLYWQKGISKAMRSDKWKLMMNDKTGDTLLYRIDRDLYESENVFNQHRVIAMELVQKHKEWRTTHAEILWPPVIYYKSVKDGKTFYFEQ